MKRMFAMLVMFVMLLCALPLNSIVAIAERAATMEEGRSYLLYSGDIMLSGAVSGDGLSGAPMPENDNEITSCCVWTYTDGILKNESRYLSVTENKLTLNSDAENTLNVSGSVGTGLLFYYGENQVYIAYDAENNRFIITQDAESACSFSFREYDPTIYAAELNITEESITLVVGDLHSLETVILPENHEETLTWYSSDESVAAVNNGVVTGIAAGTAEIKVKTAENKLSDSCTVTVVPRTYTVKFYDIDGSVMDTQTVEEGKSALAPLLTEHIGYEFMGWVPADFNNVTCDMEIYSQWKTSVYDIILVLNGGTCSEFPPNYTVETDEIVLPIPARNGYEFKGWYENPEFSGEPVEIIQKGSYGDKTLYAKWNLLYYSISYELNGGQLVGGYFTTYTIESPIIYLPQPVRTGYDFMGWYTNAHFTGEQTSSIANGTYGNLKFYASWQPHIYEIEYVLSGGELSGEYAVNYNIESDYIELPIPMRVGYKFCGWYGTEDFGGEAVIGITAGSTGNRIFYAKWEAVRYNITIRSLGGTVIGLVPATYTIESESIILPLAEKTGYAFCGWYNNPNYEGAPLTEIASGSCGDIDLYARWETVNYVIRYVLNGGCIAGVAPAGYNIESETVELPIPERVAYRFGGWYENSSFNGNAVETVESGSYGDKTFYARWSPITYYITYETNGGRLAPNAVLSYNVESMSFALPEVMRVGYYFKGWYNNPSFNGSPVTQIIMGSYGDRVYYAKWEAIVYDISYDACGGSIDGNYEDEYTIESDDIVLPIPSRLGYEFCGWYDNPQYNGSAVTKISRGSHGNKQYYAKWEIIVYNISYNTNGGIIAEGYPVSYTVESEETVLPDITKTGYEFSGWYDNPAFTGMSITAISAGSVGDREFYAKFYPTIYDIVYNTNGGILQNPINCYNIETQTFYLPIPERIGYDFAGWYEDENFNGNAISCIEKGTYGDILLYAKWDIINYSITYHVYDGTMPNEDFAITYNIESDTIILPRPTQVGYVFVGWYDNPEFRGVPKLEIESGSYGDLVFYANWRILQYKVRFFDRDYATLLAEMYVPHGSSATPPETVPEHYGYTFAGWSEDYTCVTSNLDCIAVYELTEYDVVFCDMDYTIISEQKVKHGQAATAPEPPAHDDCVFVFWSCDFSCVTSDLTVVAIYRATTVTPRPSTGQRFVNDENLSTGEDYIITVNDGENVYAMTSICRSENDGMWAMQVIITGNTIKPADSTAQITDAVFHAEGTEADGFMLTAEINGERLTCESNDLTLCSIDEEHDMFSYVYENGAWRLHDKTKALYLSFDPEQGFFEADSIDNAAEIAIYKRINIPTYMQMTEPYFGKLYTVVAVRPSGQAFALSYNGEGFTGIPVEVADGRLYFNDNIDEKSVSFRVAFGDNSKGFALRNVESSLYLSIDGGNLVPTDDIMNYWVYKENPRSGQMSLYEVNEKTYLFCNEEGGFSASNNITHTRILIFERRPAEGKVGDVNMDGTINTGDAVTILRHSSGLTPLSDEAMVLGDANRDGKVNTGDAVMMLRYTVGLVDWL